MSLWRSSLRGCASFAQRRPLYLISSRYNHSSILNVAPLQGPNCTTVEPHGLYTVRIILENTS